MPTKKTQAQEQQKVFNHKFGMLYDSLNIEEDRAKEIYHTIKESFLNTKLDNTSKKLEFVLSQGLNFQEVLYAGFLFGKTAEVNKAVKNLESPNNLFNSMFGMGIEPINIDVLYEQMFQKFNINLPS